MMIRKYLHNLIDWIFNYSLQISSISIVVLSIIGISKLNEWTANFWGLTNVPIGNFIYYPTVTIAILLGIFSISHSKSLKDLEKDNKEKSLKIVDLESSLNDSIKEMNELFNSYLTLMVKNLNFGHTERISVYKVYEDKFVMIGRASDNPNLQETGRSSYPTNEGFIGKGWAEGEYFIDDLPDPTIRNGDTYFKKVNEECSIAKETIQEIKMKSRTFFIYRIKGYDNLPKAVLVIESLKEKGFAKQEVINKLGGVKQPLVMFIEKNNGVKLQPTNDLGL